MHIIYSRVHPADLAYILLYQASLSGKESSFGGFSFFLSLIPRYMKRSAYAFQPQLKVDCYHLAEAPRLFVRKVSINDLLSRWIQHHQGEPLPDAAIYYAECERHGYINWKTAKIYTPDQLVGRNNVFVVRLHI